MEELHQSLKKAVKKLKQLPASFSYIRTVSNNGESYSPKDYEFFNHKQSDKEGTAWVCDRKGCIKNLLEAREIKMKEEENKLKII